MTSSRPRGVMSRLSSSGGTETSNVTDGCPTGQVRTILAQVFHMKHSCTWIHTFALISLVLLTSACQERSAGAGGGLWGSSQPQPNAALQSLVDGKGLETALAAPQIPSAERTRLNEHVRRVYKDLNYQLIWIEGDRPSARYAEFTKAIAAADDHGLPAELYTLPI